MSKIAGEINTEMMHPLHKIFEKDFSIPEPHRVRGITTADALTVIAKAIRMPNTRIYFSDHFGTPAATENMAFTMREIINKLELREIIVHRKGKAFFIVFGEDPNE